MPHQKCALLERSHEEDPFYDVIEVSVMPVLLGEAVKLLLDPAVQTKLKLSSQKIYRSGVVC